MITSKNIYVVYLTVYNGNKLPPYYIGSTTKNKIKNGYCGSVSSKKYKSIWLKEKKEHFKQFETIIIKEFNNRKKAFKYESKLQKEHGVVANPLFINMAYANATGTFSTGLCGENNPFYNKHHSDKTKQIISKIHKNKKLTSKHIIKLSGKNGYKFTGYYHTPFGILEAKRDIIKHTKDISPDSILNWCKNSNKIINKAAISQSKYLTEDMLGKTFKKINFWFENI